nr:unnamed protein product [Digitaria exilis]
MTSDTFVLSQDIMIELFFQLIGQGISLFFIHGSEDIIASGAGDDAICLFAEEKNSMVEGPSYKLILKKEKAHDMDINCVRWCPQDPRLLASASDDGTVKLWELKGSVLD